MLVGFSGQPEAWFAADVFFLTAGFLAKLSQAVLGPRRTEAPSCVSW